MGTKHYTKEEKDKIIELHLQNRNTVEISKAINRSQTGIERFLKSNGFEMTYGRRATKDELQDIIQLYKDGLTCKEIHKKYQYIYQSEEAIQKIVRKANVSRGRYIKQVNVNEDYFENIDTEHKAYWIGFLLADGCILERQRESNVVKFELNNKDRYIVEEFAKDIETSLNVLDYKYDKKHNCNIQIHSNKMVNDLGKYGIVPRKTFKICDLPNINNNLMNHFVRGYFDGDGCAYLYKPKDQYIHRLRITFCGTEAFLLNLKNLLEQNGINNGSMIDMNKYGSNVFNLRFISNAGIIKLYNYMYKDSTIFLNRKREKFETFIDERR